MFTKELLHLKMKNMGYSKTSLMKETGASERTLREYLNGKTVSGLYLTKILEVLDINVKEWNNCENVKAAYDIVGRWV